MPWTIEDSRNLHLVRECLEKLVERADDFFFSLLAELRRGKPLPADPDALHGRCPECREPLARNTDVRQGDDYRLECRCGFKTFELDTHHGDTEDTEKKGGGYV